MDLVEKIRAAHVAAHEGDDALTKALLDDVVESLNAPAMAQGSPEFSDVSAAETPAPWLGVCKGDFRDYNVKGFARVEPLVSTSHTGARMKGGGFTVAAQYPASAPRVGKVIVVPDLPVEKFAAMVARRSVRLGSAGKQMAYISLWSGLINTSALIELEKEIDV